MLTGLDCSKNRQEIETSKLPRMSHVSEIQVSAVMCHWLGSFAAMYCGSNYLKLITPLALPRPHLKVFPIIVRKVLNPFFSGVEKICLLGRMRIGVQQVCGYGSGKVMRTRIHNTATEGSVINIVTIPITTKYHVNTISIFELLLLVLQVCGGYEDAVIERHSITGLRISLEERSAHISEFPPPHPR